MNLGRARDERPGQTVEQQENLAVASYLHWAWLDAIEPPSREDLLAVMQASR